ncbi:RHS repeat domain-containing protein [Hydrogenophaga pseudoflava]|uniref:RHS repeat domain-containing protein n=1 Tax=Hydrogenophaga pseudoflava TaxID=47421 RepID=UPI0035B06A2B
MPVAAVIDGVHYAVHADHLNTPRRLSDSAGQTRWQWPYSGFGEIAPQSTPASGQAPVSFALRYPGQIDDGNELFYNWHRFYEPRVGRYTKADPIGLEGGWNRFGYVGGNPLGFVDPEGLAAEHTKGARPSTENKHQEGQSRRARDAGGERGDARRNLPRKAPPGYKGPWPPLRIPGILPLVCPLCNFLEPQPLPGPELCQSEPNNEVS